LRLRPSPQGRAHISLQQGKYKIAAIASSFEAIIVDRQTHRTARNRIIAVAERIDQCFAQRDRREPRRVRASEHAWFDTTAHWQIPGEKLDRFFQQLKRMAVSLPLIQEFRFNSVPKTSYPQLALWEIGQHRTAKKYNCGNQYSTMNA
jgi:hypothetical protein